MIFYRIMAEPWSLDRLSEPSPDLVRFWAESAIPPARILAHYTDLLVAEPVLRRLQLLTRLGEALRDACYFSESYVAFQTALSASIPLAGKSAKQTIAVWSALGRLMIRMGRSDQAIGCFTTASDLSMDHPTIDPLDAGLLLNNLGLCYLNLNHPEQAEPFLAHAVAYQRRYNLDPLLGAFGNLATARKLLGRPNEALMVEGLQRIAATYGPNNLAYVNSCLCYCVDLRERSRYGQAAEVAATATTAALATFGEGHPLVASALTEVGLAKIRLGDLTGALDALTEALRIFVLRGITHSIKEVAGLIESLDEVV